jgi:hypothetical protein
MSSNNWCHKMYSETLQIISHYTLQKIQSLEQITIWTPVILNLQFWTFVRSCTWSRESTIMSLKNNINFDTISMSAGYWKSLTSDKSLAVICIFSAANTIYRYSSQYELTDWEKNTTKMKYNVFRHLTEPS